MSSQPFQLTGSLPSPGHRRRVQVVDAARSLALALVAQQHTGLMVVIAPDTATAMDLERELAWYLEQTGLPVLHFPDWETLPYDNFSPQQDILSERVATLYALARAPRGVLVLPVRTGMHRLAPRRYVLGRSLDLKLGQHFDPVAERRRLEQAGYRHVDAVMEPGEFALRGALMDIFPMGAKEPVRVDLFDEEIESLRSFDPDTQRSTDRLDAVRLLPGRELPLDDDGIARFRQRWHIAFESDVRRCTVYQDVSEGHAPPGVEYYLPFFHEQLETLFDYLPADALIVTLAGTDRGATHFEQEVRARYDDHAHDIERPILQPALLFLRSDEFFAQLAPYARIDLYPADTESSLAATEIKGIEFDPHASEPGSRLQARLAKHEHRVLFTAESAGRREVLAEQLTRLGIPAHTVDDWQAFVRSEHTYALAVAPLEHAFALEQPDWLIIPEAALLGQKVAAERKRYRSVDPDLILRNLTELRIGAPVVHLEHGVGRYRGLEILEVDGESQELLVLEYAENARLYVPVSSLQLISRYAGGDESTAPLHRLGSDQWEKAKRRAAEKARDVAAELLDIYARREARTGFAFTAPDADYRRFSAQFPYEETPDQLLAIDAVLADMATAKPMDRLVCGDVGFGKTEVAMRASFIAIQSGKQVAILVPTTLLAQQHFDTLSDRFADWPVRIELLSRMRSDAEVQSAVERLARGQVDIVIGTHKLLGRGIAFARLGLVVIDEEHRFGVRHKEQLKSLRAEVDVLTLTATPIPRTLNMAVSGIRDMSIIATPPAKRLSIKTFVRESSRPLVREAIARELARGGQVFYVHNEVKSIANCTEQLQALVQDARIGVGHGQMRPRELEGVMADFHHRRTNVLVCTTIIETGIDIPNANTIIIDRADKFGLAQLHQLRGRVGRSHRQAFAYLLTPHRKAMTQDALKRLEAIEASGELGIGFTLATHDLEIRGAGELLGDGQSGQMEAVGFSLFMDMLSRAVASIRAGKTPNLDEPITSGIEVNLRVPALIPEDYLPDVHARLILYKRIASAANQDELDALQAEIHDRFGKLPAQTLQLFRITRVKLTASKLGIKRIDFGATGGAIEFEQHTSVSPMTLVLLVQQRPKDLKLDAAGNRLRVLQSADEATDRFALVEQLLAVLAAPPPAAPSAAARSKVRAR